MLALSLANPCMAGGPPPVITVQPVSLTVPLLGIATFSVTASSGTTMSYQWYKDGTAIPGGTSSSYSIITVLGSSSGTYCVKVTNAGGSVMSHDATLNVVVAPGITSQPQSLTVTQGQNVSISVVATGSTPLSYQWYLNNSKTGNNNPSLTLSNVNTNKAGNYWVVVANSAGSVTSTVATLTVYVPPTVQTHPNDQTVTQGQNASFAVVANGSQPLSYRWNFNGSAVPGVTNASLTLTNVQGSQAGAYTAVVMNPAGSVTSHVATLTVVIPPTITTQPQSQLVLAHQNVSLQVVAGGTAPLHYQWYFNGSQMGPDNSTLKLDNVAAQNLGSYVVLVNNSWGSVTSSVATIGLAVPPTIATQPQSQTLTQGQVALLSVVANGTAPFTYQWSCNGSAICDATNCSLALTNAQLTNSGTYAVAITNCAGSVTSAAANLTVNPVFALSVPGTAGMTANGFSFQLSVPIGRTYVIWASSDFHTWTPIATNIATSASAAFVDSGATNCPCRVYRAVLQ